MQPLHRFEPVLLPARPASPRENTIRDLEIRAPASRDRPAPRNRPPLYVEQSRAPPRRYHLSLAAKNLTCWRARASARHKLLLTAPCRGCTLSFPPPPAAL